jgi:tRNA(fMet)-specific endonuclease VapC
VAVTHVSRVVLDTSAYSRLRTGHPDVIEWLAAASVVFVPTIVIGELHAGFRIGRRRRDNEQALGAFLDEPFVQVATVDADAAHRYGEIVAQLRDAGTPIPTNDIWIAAVTFVTGGHLMTFDTDFARVGGLPHTLLG